MIQINPSPEDIEIFKNERRNHPHPRVQQRMEVLWLKTVGLRHKNISKISGVSINIVTKYLRMYNSGGIEKLRKINFYKPQSKLVEYKSSIEDYFKKHPPASIKEAMGKIEEITGLKRSETQIRNFLTKTLGFKRRKVASIPAKADLKEQEDFKKKSLNHDLKKQKIIKEKSFLWMPPILS